MTVELVVLALLMMAVTYPSRAVPLLAPGMERLPARALDYLRFVGPASLAALAAVNSTVTGGVDEQRTLQVGVEALAVVVCIAVVAWRRNLFLGIAAAVVLVAAVRVVSPG